MLCQDVGIIYDMTILYTVQTHPVAQTHPINHSATETLHDSIFMRENDGVVEREEILTF